MAMEDYLDPLNIPGWTRPINKVSVRKIIDDAIEAKNNASRILIPSKKQSKMAVIIVKKGVKRAKMAKIKNYYLRRSRNKSY